MRLLLVLAAALLPVGALSGWAGVGLLRARKASRLGGTPAPATAERLGSAVVCVLCMAVAALATTAGVATLVLAALAFG